MDTATIGRIEYLEENVQAIKTRLDVMEAKLDRGFERMDVRFDRLETWLKEHL